MPFVFDCLRLCGLFLSIYLSSSFSLPDCLLVFPLLSLYLCLSAVYFCLLTCLPHSLCLTVCLSVSFSLPDRCLSVSLWLPVCRRIVHLCFSRAVSNSQYCGCPHKVSYSQSVDQTYSGIICLFVPLLVEQSPSHSLIILESRI